MKIPWHFTSCLPKWIESKQVQHLVLLMHIISVKRWGILCFIPDGLVILSKSSLDVKTVLSVWSDWILGEAIIAVCIARDIGETGISAVEGTLLDKLWTAKKSD